MSLIGTRNKEVLSPAEAEALLAALRASIAGDYSVRLPITWKGTKGEIAETFNQLVSARASVLNDFARIFETVGKDGLLDSRLNAGNYKGRLGDLSETFNTMLDSLLAPLDEMMTITSAVAQGDLGKRVPLVVGGKKKTGQLLVWAEMMNEMLRVLSTLAIEVSRTAHEIGVEGKLGGQAVVPGAAGIWRDVTEAVNALAMSRTTQLKQMGEIATSVLRKDFSHVIDMKAQGEVAEILAKINQMVKFLEESTQRDAEQDWLKTNYAKLAHHMQGLRDIKVASSVMLDEIAPLVGTAYGVFYVLDFSVTKERQLKAFASYAYQGRLDSAQNWAIGEGLVGQCAKSKQPISVSDIPANYFDVASGTGKAKPTSLLFYPVLYEGNIKGIIELASFRPFTAVEQTLLEEIAESFGIVLNTIQIDMQTEELLRQSQSLTEEMQLQQEEIRATNQELEDKAEQLALSSKYKSEFLSNMSHELRTPLNSLLILAEHLENNRAGHLDEKEVEFAKLIHVSGNDLLTLINEILDLSKIESGTVTLSQAKIDLSELRAQLINTFAHIARDKGLDFEINIEVDVQQQIITDEMRLLQILKNLLANSFKFTQQGSVCLNIVMSEHEASERRKGSLPAESTIVFEVVDTGIGISKAKEKIVFEPFQQGDGGSSRKYGGTGLGLSISRELSHLLGGELRLKKSVLNVGSTFALYLPLEPASQTNTQHQESIRNLAKLPNRTEKEFELREANHIASRNDYSAHSDDRESIEVGDRVLMIVENDESFAQILLDLAREKGFKGVVARRGAEALSIAREYKLDAITLAIHIPDVDGWAILDLFKQDLALRHIPIDVITVEKDAERALSRGAFHFISKPASREELESAFDAIREFLDRPLRTLLLLTTDQEDKKDVTDLLQGEDLRIDHVERGDAALQVLAEHDYGCIVVGVDLDDMSGTDFVRLMQTYEHLRSIPVVMFSNQLFSEQDQENLRTLSEYGIVKDADTLDRLLDQTALFLHRVLAELPEAKRDSIERNSRSRDHLMGRKVLIVDDDQRNIFALTAALEARGAKIHSVGDGLSAIKALERTPDIAIVLMDIMMPGLDGYETMRTIRKIEDFQSLPIIALTAKAMVGDREKCIEAGASDYLSKPVAIEQLVSLMQVWLSKR